MSYRSVSARVPLHSSHQMSKRRHYETLFSKHAYLSDPSQTHPRSSEWILLLASNPLRKTIPISVTILTEISNPQNPKSNPIAEKAVQNIEKEPLKVDPTGVKVSSVSLAITCCILKCRVGSLRLSPREILYHRDQFTDKRIHFNDMDLITKQYQKRDINHSHSEPNRTRRPHTEVAIDDVVYLPRDFTENNGRERYLVSSKQNGLVHIRKFAGSQDVQSPRGRMLPSSKWLQRHCQNRTQWHRRRRRSFSSTYQTCHPR